MYQQELDLAQARRLATQYPEHYFYQGNGNRLEIALTFSDGPAPTTAPLLDLLRVHQVPATFFWQGNLLAGHHQLLRQILADGHTVGSHTWDHVHAAEISVADFWLEQIQRTDQEFQRLAGLRPRLYRPPYAELTAEQLRMLVRHDFRVMGWSIDPRNWEHPDAQGHVMRVTETILRQIHPQAIIVLHEGEARMHNVADIVEQVVPALKSRGYRFVTADRLTGVRAYG
ncbi:peptidoglycan/xylan/chitin deacetylase (PgdA/CDA1 family) [Silvimonas terrae]|uniref:Peptidoglycan/xylan/chitin deacetylase (PgdA/CDA1 family) n=1 Tax=Silvimonas terrae TaxID=300266 RepID=A0A840RLL4_9NEIS|nr:polysaccharide deacetylase family protein [Silvimonas terrae]MBB5193494.1 peptidoglycan/xylan/chitin deacetylase (PgdA/CDA1 family) [Silvimonas terrae]